MFDSGSCVLGIDPGLTRCGVGVVGGPPGHPVHVAHDCIRTSPDLPLEQRLLALHAALSEMIATFSPTLIAVERVLFSNNVRTAMATGQAAGVALLTAATAGVDVIQLTPTDVKASVTGDGTADKDAVARMVAAQLRLDAPPRPADAADALAVALTAITRQRMSGLAAKGAMGGSATTSRGSATAGAGSWEAALASGKLRVAGGTSTKDARR